MIVKQPRCGPFLSLCINNFQSPSKFLLRSHSSISRPIGSTARDPSSSWLAPSNSSRPDLIYVSTSTDPFENLAIEHHLLNHGPPDDGVLFLYVNRPCVVIGRNQNPWIECNLKALSQGLRTPQRDAHSSREALQHEEVLLVRRRSGGGTVFHDLGNLNYSIIVPHDRTFTRRRYPEMIVQALQKHFVSKGDGQRHISVNERNDIVLKTPASDGPLKISGSAYKLTRGKALTHGTLLFASPNLHRISDILRSPGKPYLKAKGVESVRSPVGNLFPGTLTATERLSIRDEMCQAIISQWKTSTRKTRETVEVGTWDCQKQVNAEIASGVDELMSDEYRFEQTPGFEVNTGLVDGQGMTFTVKSGLIEAVAMVGTGFGSDTENQWCQQLTGRKLQDVNSWTGAQNPLADPVPLLERLDLIFPAVKTGLGHTRSPVESGLTEIEVQGTNTVTEVPVHEVDRSGQHYKG